MPYKAKQEGLPGKEKPLLICSADLTKAQVDLGSVQRCEILGIADELCSIGDLEYNVGRYLKLKRARRRYLSHKIQKAAEGYRTFISGHHD